MAATRFVNKGLLVRAFSTSRVQLAEQQAPIKLFGVEGRYAHALFSAASTTKSLEKVEAELNQVQALMTEQPKLAAYCLDPTVNKVEKKNLIEDIFKAAELSQTTVNFMGLLAENSRLKRADGIINAYHKIMRAVRGEVDCVITTAKPLDAATTKTLNATLKKFIKPTETLKVKTAIDADIMGGMVINLGDYFIDMSTATKVKKISQALKGGL